MSENNVENTSFKIDDVSEEKSQFEIDNEKRAQLEREQAQETAEQVDDMQETQEEQEQEQVQEQGQEQVQEQGQEQVQEQAPIHISHKTQIVDNFFDEPPPVRKTQNSNTQAENVQTNNHQQNVENNNVSAQNQVQNTADNNVENQVQNAAKVQNVQTNTQQNQANITNDKAENEVKVETKPEPAEPLPPIKPPKHNTVIVDNNLDMPRKKVASPTTNASNSNTNTQSADNSQNVQTQAQNQTQSQVQNTAQSTDAVQNVQINAQQNQASVTNDKTVNEAKVETKPEPAEPLPPIKPPKHNTVIVDNNLDMPEKKVASPTTNASNSNTNTQSADNRQNVQTKAQNQTQSQVQNTAQSTDAVQNAQTNAQQNQASVTKNQVVNEVKAEAKVEPPPIKLPKHDTVIVDNNLDMPRKKVAPPTTNGSNSDTSQNTQSANSSQNVQAQAQNQIQSQVQNTATVQNVQSNAQQKQASVTNNQAVNEVKAETKVETPPPIKLPKHDTVIVDNNLDMPKKKVVAEKPDVKAGNTNQNTQNTATVQNEQTNAQQNQASVTKNRVVNGVKAETKVETPPPIKLPKHETVIVDNNLDVGIGKKNKKNKKAGKNADANKNTAKQTEVKTVQQTSQSVDKLAENKEQEKETIKNVEQSVPNKETKTKNAKQQETTGKIAIETSPQEEKPKVDEINKKVNSIPENDISSNVRRPQMVSQGTSEIISLITPDVYAGFGIRCVAFVIDALFVIGLMNIALYFGIESYIPISIGIVYMILFAFYSFIFVYIFDGQSIGKMLTGIKVVEDNGNKLGLFTAFVREFAGKLIMIPLFILFIFTAFSYKKHSLMDYLSDTSVIKSKYQSLYYELMTEMAD